LKATGLQGLVSGIAPLLNENTGIVFAQNGIPWWYDIGLAADQPPPPDLGFLDPGARLRLAVSRDRIVGGVIFSSNEITAPGIVVNDSPERNMLLVGECDDRPSQRIERLRAALNEALIQSPPVPRIREAIWTKLTSNMSVSVLCSLTGKTARLTMEDPALQAFVPRLLDEAQAVARSCYPGITRRTGRAPDHLPSLRQDFDRGRPMEIDALVTAPAAFARAAGLATPTLDTIAGLATRQARDKGLYGG
jgi:2-dehydropantoate 2-reductase